jgi:uncharacterized protein
MKNPKFTIIGLLISYFGILLTGLFFKTFFNTPLGDGLTLLRELTNFILVGILGWIIIKKEGLPFDSIGIRKIDWKQTAIWSIITGLFCVVGLFVCLGIIQVLGLEYGQSKSPLKLSMITTTLVMLRAGIAEEVFFRGYIFERIQFLLKSKWIAIVLSVIPFALLHYTQGLPGMLISLVLGGILSTMSIWKRNLKANMIAHFIIDFIPNVVIPLVMR